MAMPIAPREQYVYSFLFRVDELPTNDDPGVRGSVPPRYLQGRWVPPNVPQGYFPPVIGDMYRWSNGTVGSAEEINGYLLNEYRAATVFYCNDFYQFFTARGWANTRDMEKADPEDDWHCLSFLYGGNGLSCVEHVGEDRLAVKYASWIGQVVPSTYGARHSSHGLGGLSGLLPLIAALVAFSCKDRAALLKILTKDQAWRDWQWCKHRRPSGRIEGRGVIVTVFYDPSNPGGSTKEILEWIEQGGVAPIFK